MEDCGTTRYAEPIVSTASTIPLPPSLDAYGPRVLVVGGASAVGAAFAARLARAGRAVVLVDSDGDGLAEVGARLRKEGGDVQDVVLSPGRRDFGVALRDALGERRRDLFLTVFVPEAPVMGPFLSMRENERAWVPEFACRGVVELVSALAGRLARKGQGGFILLTADPDLRAQASPALQAGAEAFVRQFGEVLHDELKPHGISVLVVAPPHGDALRLPELVDGAFAALARGEAVWAQGFWTRLWLRLSAWFRRRNRRVDAPLRAVTFDDVTDFGPRGGI